MNELEELLHLYVERARTAGAEAEVVPRDALTTKLNTLVAEVSAHVVAVPATGWPQGIRETVVKALERLGCRVVSPVPGIDGYAWDRQTLAAAELGITWCDALLADTGSLVFPSGPGLGTAASLLPFVHLALGSSESVCAGLGVHLAALGTNLPSRLTLVTGPSRTGDIEGTMTTGVHGPGRVLHWILAEPA